MPNSTAVKQLKKEFALSGCADPFQILAEFAHRNEQLEDEIKRLKLIIDLECASAPEISRECLACGKLGVWVG